MKKHRLLAIVMGMMMTAALSPEAFAKDGSTSCTFRTISGASGAGYLSVASSQMLARTTIPANGNYAAVEMKYHYKTEGGSLVEKTLRDESVQTVQVKKALPSKTSERKATSEHYEDVPPNVNVGYCSLW